MQAKEEIVVRCEFTIRAEKYQEIPDFGELARNGKAWFDREVRSMISETFPDADNIQVGAQYFIHEKPEEEIITYREYFLSKFPNAKVCGIDYGSPGRPFVCREEIYGEITECPCKSGAVTSCADCWDQPMVIAKELDAPDWSEIERSCE